MLGFYRDIVVILENQMDKKLEHDAQTRVISWFKGSTIPTVLHILGQIGFLFLRTVGRYFLFRNT